MNPQQQQQNAYLPALQPQIIAASGGAQQSLHNQLFQGRMASSSAPPPEPEKDELTKGIERVAELQKLKLLCMTTLLCVAVVVGGVIVNNFIRGAQKSAMLKMGICEVWNPTGYWETKKCQ